MSDDDKTLLADIRDLLAGIPDTIGHLRDDMQSIDRRNTLAHWILAGIIVGVVVLFALALQFQWIAKAQGVQFKESVPVTERGIEDFRVH